MGKTILDHWSYSAWSLHKKCPFAFYNSYILKLKQPDNTAMARGTMIHSLAEQYLKGGITGGVPKQLNKLATEYRLLKKARPIVEKFWGVNAQWKPSGYPSWCVMKMDAAIVPTKKDPTLWIGDHKTGRIYPDHVKQGSLYVSIGFALYPKIELATAEFLYTDQGKVEAHEFTRSQIRHQVKYWQEEGKKLISQTKFLPKPSYNACQYCGYRDDKKLANGKKGPCAAYKVVRFK